MKKKILAITLCVAMLAIMLVSGTLAYFTDEKEQTNTFTAGKVEITLDEAIVEKNDSGNLVSTGERTREDQTEQKYHLFPGMTVTKDPTITLVEGSENAYIGAIVTVSGNLHSLIGVEGYNNLDITKLVSGGLVAAPSTQVFDWNGLPMVYETETCVIYQDASRGSQDGNGTWTMYIFIKEPVTTTKKVVLFDTMTIPKAWDNAEMAKINGMSINVQAYAVQANGFTGEYACYNAMVAAFGQNTGDPFKF